MPVRQRRRDRGQRPAGQEKILKFSTLLANAVIFHTTVDMMTVIRELIAEGWQITPEDLAVLSPYVTARVSASGCMPPTRSP